MEWYKHSRWCGHIRCASLPGGRKCIPDYFSYFCNHRQKLFNSQSGCDAAGGSQKQITTLTVAGTADGDVITGTINGKAFAFTLTDHDSTSAVTSTVAAHDGTGAIVAAKTGATTLTLTGSANNIAFTVENLRVGNGVGAAVGGYDLTTSTLANSAITNLSTQINSVDSSRASTGAAMSRLEYAADNLTNVAQNSAAARSRILDADYAAETTELARTQIIQQAATAMLAQANASAAQVWRY